MEDSSSMLSSHGLLLLVVCLQTPSDIFLWIIVLLAWRDAEDESSSSRGGEGGIRSWEAGEDC